MGNLRGYFQIEFKLYKNPSPNNTDYHLKKRNEITINKITLLKISVFTWWKPGQCYVSCPSFESDFEPAVSIRRECVGSLHFRGFWPIYPIILPVHFLFLRCSGNNKSGIFLSKHSSGHCPAAGQFYFSKVIDTRSPK